MKKKILVILMTMCMVVSLSSCGEKEHKFADITIEGEKYNLSEDFEDVVKALNENDIQVVSYLHSSMLKRSVYNEDCKLEKVEGCEDSCLYADYTPVSKYHFPSEEKNSDDLVIKIFELWKDTVEFETASGITWDSDEDDLKELEGYVKMDVVFWPNQTTYGALYVDGKIVDLENYEDEFEEWKNYLNENGFLKAMDKYLPNRQYYHLTSRIWADLFMTSRTYEELKEGCDEKGLPLKNVMLTNIAMHDAGDKLEDGKIESYALIRYESSKDGGIFMSYQEYSIDEDWNEDDYK